MDKKRTKHESAVLAIITLAVIAAVCFFVIKIWFPELIKREEEISFENEIEEESSVPEVTIEQLREKIETSNDHIILDVQEIDDFLEATIPTSINIPLTELDQKFNEIPKNKEIIVVDAGENCQECVRGTEMLLANGFVDVKKLDGGVQVWANAGYPIVSGNNVTFQNIDAKGLMDNIEANENMVIIDVRDEEEYNESHIIGAVHSLFLGVIDEADNYPRNKIIIIYDKAGNRSKIAVQQFIKKGFIDIYNLLDGFDGWVKEGLPVE